MRASFYFALSIYVGGFIASNWDVIEGGLAGLLP